MATNGSSWQERVLNDGVAKFGSKVWLITQQNIESSLLYDQEPGTKKELLKLIHECNVEELQSRFGTRVAFGTAGVRGRMEVGCCRMNELVVIQTTQGLCRCLCKAAKDDGVTPLKIVIGYDGRHNSRRFSLLAANVCVKMGIATYLFDEVVATPIVSYAVRKLMTGAGIMITASHNPKQDNGYKVYWSNGAQILDDIAKQICKHADDDGKPLDGVWDTSNIASFVTNPRKGMHDVIADYFAENVEKYCFHSDLNKSSQLKLTYTALHGVGQTFSPILLGKFGFSSNRITSVEEQAQPDPDFSTLGDAFPNPEEGRSVLDLAISTANRAQSDLILANDPDADRLQVCERDGDDWRVFTGNEMGALLAWWCWRCWRLAHPSDDPADVYMINSDVSSRVVAAIAAHEHFNYEETPTGFKNMANRAAVLRERGKTVLLAWEESIGYMPGESLDKDGVLAAAMFAECAAYLRHAHHRTLQQQLDEIFRAYGVHLTQNSYFMCPDPAVKTEIFNHLRFGALESRSTTIKFPEKVGRFGIIKVEDMDTLKIRFTLDNGCVATVRASGTEPKLKYYLELVTAPGLDVAAEIGRLRQELLEVESAVSSVLIKADKYNLEKKKA